jgi:hypothetical protein
MKDQTRRDFIFDSTKIIGFTIGTTVLGKDLLLPQVVEAEDVQFPEASCGSKNKGGHKILIAYASEFGTTGEVAAAIGEVLCQEGYTVETKWVKNVKDINNYDQVIIGSAILFNKGVKEGDYRDWNAIRAWAKDAQLKLNLAPV